MTSDAAGPSTPRGTNLAIRLLAQAERWDEARELVVAWPFERPCAWMSVDTDAAFALAHQQRRSGPMGSHDLVVFAHLPFCGGTSLTTALTASFGPRTLDITRRHGLRTIQRYLRLSDERQKAIRYVHHHHPFPLDHRGRPVRRIVATRDPADQILSGYRKRRQDPTILPTRSLDEHTDLWAAVEHHERNGLVNLQVRELAAHHPALAGVYARHYPVRRQSWARLHRYRLAIGRKLHREPVSHRFEAVKHEDALFCWAATARIPDAELLDMAREVVAGCGDSVIPTQLFDSAYRITMASLGRIVVLRPPHRGRSQTRDHDGDAALRDHVSAMSPLDVQLHGEVTRRVESGWPEITQAIAETR